MTQTFRVRFTPGVDSRVCADQVRTVDHPGSLADLPGLLPAGVYVLSIANLAEGRDVHWPRWPASIRPGMTDEAGDPLDRGAIPRAW